MSNTFKWLVSYEVYIDSTIPQVENSDFDSETEKLDLDEVRKKLKTNYERAHPNKKIKIGKIAAKQMQGG